MWLWSIELKLINFLPINWNLAPAEFQQVSKFIMVSRNMLSLYSCKGAVPFLLVPFPNDFPLAVSSQNNVN